MNFELILPEALLKEKWDWVDRYLEELYYGYALTCENYDEYLAAGMMAEKWGWMDYDLENQYNREDDMRILCPAPISWINGAEKTEKHILLEEEEQRSRAESDISDYSDTVERVVNQLNRVSPLSCSSKRFGSYSESDTEYNALYYDCDGYDSH